MDIALGENLFRYFQMGMFASAYGFPRPVDDVIVWMCI